MAGVVSLPQREPTVRLRASPATAAWTTAAPPGTPDLSRRHCLLYLGQAAGTTVFYDVRTRESLHVPSAQILLTLPDVEGIARTCS